MKIKDLKELVNSTTEWDEYDLTIEVELTEGYFHPGTPTTIVNSMHIGFDWDYGKFMLGTKEKLKIKA